MAFTIKAESGATRISLLYSAGGYFDLSVDAIASAGDGVLGEQPSRLADYLEEK